MYVFIYVMYIRHIISLKNIPKQVSIQHKRVLGCENISNNAYKFRISERDYDTTFVMSWIYIRHLSYFNYVYKE